MIRVVKVGGRTQSDPRLSVALRNAARTCDAPTDTGASLCVVHGGGDEVSALQRRLGLEPQFHGGRRVTNAADLEVVRMVLSGTINKRVVALLLAQGMRAVGISGEDGFLFAARATHRAMMGRVGGAVSVNPAIVLHLLAGGYVPVISPLARDMDDAGIGNGGLNVNGDDAAAAVAAALRADELLFVVDVQGVVVDGAVVSSLDSDDASALVTSGAALGGMSAKLEAAARALDGGVGVVRIAGIEGIGNAGAGTRILLSHSSAREIR